MVRGCWGHQQLHPSPPLWLNSYPGKEGGVKLIWELHGEVFLQKAGRSEAALSGPVQGAISHRTALAQRGVQETGHMPSLSSQGEPACYNSCMTH